MDGGIQVQSDLPLGHVVRHIPLVSRVQRGGLIQTGGSPIDYPPKALRPEEGSHLRLPFVVVPIQDGNIGGYGRGGIVGRM